MNEGGKTSAALEVMKNMLNTQKKAKGFYIKAEGRLSNEMVARSGVKFVYDAKEWKTGTCFVFESNIYEVVVDAIKTLVEQNEDEHQYCFILDSVDGLISKQDIDKSFYDSNKVAGGAVIAANFMKRMSYISCKKGSYGHFHQSSKGRHQTRPIHESSDTSDVSNGWKCIVTLC